MGYYYERMWNVSTSRYFDVVATSIVVISDLDFRFSGIEFLIFNCVARLHADGYFTYNIVLSLSELCSFVHFDSLSPLHSWRRAPGRYGYGLRKSATFKHQFSRSNTPETL